MTGMASPTVRCPVGKLVEQQQIVRRAEGRNGGHQGRSSQAAALHDRRPDHRQRAEAQARGSAGLANEAADFVFPPASLSPPAIRREARRGGESLALGPKQRAIVAVLAVAVLVLALVVWGPWPADDRLGSSASETAVAAQPGARLAFVPRRAPVGTRAVPGPGVPVAEAAP